MNDQRLSSSGGRHQRQPPSVPLRELLWCITPLEVIGRRDVVVTDIVFDSRRVVAGDLFVALPGRRDDGARYIAEAAERGAVATVTQRPAPAAPITQVVVADARRAMAVLAAEFWGNPSRQICLVGVTGTDGKTTTAALIAELFDAAGLDSGLITTARVRLDGQPMPSPFHQTTPEAPDVQRALARIVASGASHAVLEVSSHALVLDRVLGCEFDAAVFTNLSEEHLDFHQTMAEYRAAKVKLFEGLGASNHKQRGRFGVINADDPAAAHFRRACAVERLSYGIEMRADIRAREVRLEPASSSFLVETPVGSRRLTTRFVGRFNVYNWLAAIAVAIGAGLDLEIVEHTARVAEPVPGRLQRVRAGQPFHVLVDFAHTPRALVAVLETCRLLSRGRIILVVGHPGERYVAQRPRLGAIGARYADLAIITEDDAYGEDRDQIIGQIVAGAVRAGGVESRDFLVVPDRRRAIETAVRLAQPGDLVLIAGRGHLQEMVIGQRRVPFDDAEVAESAIRRIVPATA